MKKLNLILLLSLVCTLISTAQETKAIANKLKSITVHEQKYEKGVAGKVLMESVIRYDPAGNIVEEIEYKQGKINKHFTYKYDVAGNKIQETELDPSGKKIRISVYTYNKNLRMEKVVYDGNNQVLSRKTYKYETY